MVFSLTTCPAVDLANWLLATGHMGDLGRGPCGRVLKAFWYRCKKWGIIHQRSGSRTSPVGVWVACLSHLGNVPERKNWRRFRMRIMSDHESHRTPAKKDLAFMHAKKRAQQKITMLT